MSTTCSSLVHDLYYMFCSLLAHQYIFSPERRILFGQIDHFVIFFFKTCYIVWIAKWKCRKPNEFFLHVIHFKAVQPFWPRPISYSFISWAVSGQVGVPFFSVQCIVLLWNNNTELQYDGMKCDWTNRTWNVTTRHSVAYPNNTKLIGGSTAYSRYK